MARAMLRRVREEGPLRTSEFGGGGGGGWWDHGVERKVLLTLWSAGDLAIRERVGFQRVYDLPERVIPGRLLSRPVPPEDAVRALVLRALEGHGWATRATLAATWRIRPPGRVDRALRDLEEGGEAVRCDLVAGDGARVPGWARPRDLDLAARLARLSPREDRGVLLSPFDPVLWDRTRVGTLFGFHQRLECYTPARRRVYGYFCLPVLAGERLVARVDLKADRGAGRVRLLALHHEAGHPSPADREAVRTALARHAAGVGLSPPG